MRFEAPETIEAASALMGAEAGLARVLAGGTDLIVQMRSGFTEPDLVVDIKRIPATRVIAEEAGGFRIGASAPAARLASNARLCALWPGVVEAAELIGSTQIQGRATIAGNLCNASPAADTVPALLAARATATVVGPGGRREVPVETVPVAPGKTSLAKGELVESLFLPARPAHAGDAYLRFIPRTEMDIAVVGAGVSLVLDGGGVCTDARIALGAVGPRVIVVEEAAAALIGTKVDEAALEAAASAASAACRPIDDKRGTRAFRIRVAGVLTRRAALQALDRARSR